jgi:hypothetical protein
MASFMRTVVEAMKAASAVAIAAAWAARAAVSASVASGRVTLMEIRLA